MRKAAGEAKRRTDAYFGLYKGCKSGQGKFGFMSSILVNLASNFSLVEFDFNRCHFCSTAHTSTGCVRSTILSSALSTV